MKGVYIVLAIVSLVASSVNTYGQQHSTEIEPFTAIAGKHISGPELAEAITQLPVTVTEPPQFWSRIANDRGYPNFQRRQTAFQLFKRHVHIGMRVLALAQVLNHPTWLGPGDIARCDMVGGFVPIHFNGTDAVFALRGLTVQSNFAVYLRVTGRVDVQALRGLIVGQSKAEPGDFPYFGKRPNRQVETAKAEQARIAEMSIWSANGSPTGEIYWPGGARRPRPHVSYSGP